MAGKAIILPRRPQPRVRLRTRSIHRTEENVLAGSAPACVRNPRCHKTTCRSYRPVVTNLEDPRYCGLSDVGLWRHRGENKKIKKYPLNIKLPKQFKINRQGKTKKQSIFTRLYNFLNKYYAHTN